MSAAWSRPSWRTSPTTPWMTVVGVGGVVETILAHVADHADYGHPRRCTGPPIEQDVLADGVLSAELDPRAGFADQGHAGRGGGVLFGEETTTLERNAHDAKVD